MVWDERVLRAGPMPLCEPNLFFHFVFHYFHILFIPSAYAATLSSRIGKVVASHAEGCKIESQLWLSCTDLYYARGAQGVLPIRVGGVTSQLDLRSLTPVSVAGCGRLQLGVPHWATSVITATS